MGAALPGRGGGGWGGPTEKVGLGMVEHVEEGPRPNRILKSNSSENASMSNELSENTMVHSINILFILTQFPERSRFHFAFSTTSILCIVIVVGGRAECCKEEL